MALKPTIYKSNIALSDLSRNYYDTLNLTIAQHPSETLERTMVRLAAFCFNARDGLVFTKGLSTTDEPDIVAYDADGSVLLWLEVGEPTPERIKKATRVAQQVAIYSFNAKSPIWWEKNNKAFDAMNVSIYQFSWTEVQALARMATRSMDWSVTISDGTVYFASESNLCALHCTALQTVND